MLALSTPFATVFHPIPAGAKLLALLLCSTMLFLVTSLSLHILFLIGTTLLYVSQGTAFLWFGVRLLKPLWIFIAIIALWHVFTADIPQGLIILIRMITAVSLANLVTCTTPTDALIDTVMRLFSPLKRFGVKPKRIGLMIALFLRFTPVLIQKSAHLQDAFRARSAKKSTWKTVLPLAVIALDDAEHVAEALRARGGIDGT